ncbi:hypothetical protein IC229_00220 [Spirosoma sp. BT702]|uniref:Monoheme cytochrome C n=1 Tax=Spirosoma profusum TaxID=2771354 RepID=A0A927AT16_9BACT|nr:hypothetical protein [Spirosoma profusum]MBD2699042.1 hypothetical protein [Spirosoma profusum]
MKVITLSFFIGLVSIAMLSFQTTSPLQQPATSNVVIDTVKTDPESGLAIDPSLTMVKAQCTACHSSKLILQHRFTRDGWVERIRWMQKYHKLWDLGESEKVVLDYLEKHYGPQSAQVTVSPRRAPLKNIQWYKLP